MLIRRGRVTVDDDNAEASNRPRHRRTLGCKCPWVQGEDGFDDSPTREAQRLLESVLELDVRLVRGMSSRHKVFQVGPADPEVVRRKLGLAG